MFLPDKQNRYSIRKFSVGVCSAIIGLSFLTSTQVAAAETEELKPEVTPIVKEVAQAIENVPVTSPKEALEQAEETAQPTNQTDNASSQPTIVMDRAAEPTSSPEVTVGVTNISAKSGNNTSPEAVLDGNPGTVWESVPSQPNSYEGMYDHNRVLDLTLDGTYDLTKITVKTKVDNSFSNYYLYASEDGKDYKRIAAKVDETPATAQGETYALENTRAAYIRVNMAYNSEHFVTNLAELDIRGHKVSDHIPAKEPITVTDWEKSEWKEKWDRFEEDKTYAKDTVIKQMGELVGRVIGQEWQDKFTFEFKEAINDKDTFEIDNRSDGGIVIKANNGIAFASGFNYYLKNYAKVDYDPVFASNTAFSEVTPVEGPVIKQANFDHRYALNYTTYSYTMAFWNWDEYEKFLDWSAMNGINLMLDIVGQEEVLRQTLREFNYTDQEIKDYIPGPAYYAWFYMQNLYSIGGPLPDNWFAQRVELGRRIHDRMQTFGIKPVIQGFAGQVPETFAQKNPGAVLTPKDHWPNFIRPSIIKTYLTQEERQAGKEDFFSRVADVFYAKQRNVFGSVSHYYSTDPFHEGGNTGGLDVRQIYRSVQQKMLEHDPQAIWVMQQWQGNLKAPQMLDLDKSKLLALDLQTDMRHEHGLFENNGTPWIYNVLHNFGGRMGSDGNLTKVAVDPLKMLKQRKHMVGIGLTAEALENSPVVYGLLFDTNWADGPIDINQWLDKYAERRIGSDYAPIKEAWKLLLETSYRDKGQYYQGAPESVINARPTENFKAASTWGHSSIYYDREKLDQALKLMLSGYDTFKDSAAYRYDVAELANQVLSNGAKEYYDRMIAAKQERNLNKFNHYAGEFLKTIDLTDQLAATTQKFMLDNWILMARKMLPDADDWTSDLFEANARTIVTTWGTERSGSLKDYSNRKWSGLTADFYKKRWEIWIRNRQAELAGTSKRPEDVKAESNWYRWESRWTTRKSDTADLVTQPDTTSLGSLARTVLNQHSYSTIKRQGEQLIPKSNLVLGKTFVTASETAEGKISLLSDGLTDFTWQPKGGGRHQLEVDLDGTYRLDSINLAFPQLATTFPYDIDVEVFNPFLNDWTLVERRYNRQLDANESFTTTAIASKFRLKMTSRETTSPIRLNDIEIIGHALGEERVNLVKGVTPTTNKGNTDNSFPLTNITDGNESNLWKTTDWGTRAYPATVTVPVAETALVDTIDVVFESAGRPFKFVLKVTELDGRETVVHDTYRDHNGTLAEKAYSAFVGRQIKAATVEFLGITGKGQYSQSGPALSELRVMGYQKQDELKDLTSGSLPTTNKQNTDQAYPLSFITDGNPATFWKTTDWGNAAYPAHVELTAPEGNIVDHLKISFEKAGLPFKFDVKVTELDGRETVVYDRYRNHTGTLAEKDFVIPVKRAIRSAKIDYYGITGKGTFYAAGPALAEFNLMGHLKADDYLLADYAELNKVLERVPSNLSLYKEEVAQPLQALLAAISPNRERHEQELVNDWQSKLTSYLERLSYKAADYSAIRSILSTVPEDLTNYTLTTVLNLDRVMQQIDYNKLITEQEQVDAYIEPLRQAVSGLVRQPQTAGDLLARIHSLEEELTQLRQEKDTISAENARLSSELQAVQADKETVTAQLTQANALKEQAQSDLDSVNRTVQTLTTEKTELASELSRVKLKNDTIIAENARLSSELQAVQADKEVITAQLAQANALKEQAQSELDTANRSIQALTSEKTELAGELSRVSLENDTISAENARLSSELQTAQADKEVITAQLTQANALKEQAQSELDSANRSIQALTTEKTELSNELNRVSLEKDTISAENARLSSNLQAVQADKEVITAQLAQSNALKEQAQSELDTANRTIQTLTTEQAELASELNRVNLEKDAISAEKDTVTAQLAQANALKEQAQAELDSANRSIQALTSEKAELASELSRLSLEKDAISAEKVRLADELQAVQAEKEVITAQLAQANALKEQVQADLENANRSIQTLTTEKAELSRELSRVSLEKDAIIAEKDTITAQLAQSNALKEQVESGFENANKSIQALTTEKTELAGELSRVKLENDTISAENVRLTNELQTAQADKEVITAQLAQATTLKEQAESDLENASRSIQALTTEKTELASELNRVRIEKDVVGADNERLSSELQAVQADKETVTAQLTQANALKEQAQSELDSVNRTVQTLTTEKTELSNELNRVSLEKDAISAEKDTVTAQLAQSNALKEQAQSELDTANRRIQALTTEKTELAGELSRVKLENDTISAEKERLSNELKTAQADKETVTTQLTQANALREQAESDLESANRSIQTLTTEKTELSNELNRVSLEKDNISEEKVRLANELQAVQADKEIITAQLTQANALKEQAQSELDTANRSIQALTYEKTELAGELSRVKLENNTISAENKRLSNELQAVQADKEVITAQLAQTNALKEQAQSELDSANRSIQALTTEKTELASELSRVKFENDVISAENKRLSNELQAVQADKEVITAQLAQANALKEQVQAELDSANRTVQALVTEKARLFEDNSRLHSQLEQTRRQELSEETNNVPSEKPAQETDDRLSEPHPTSPSANEKDKQPQQTAPRELNDTGSGVHIKLAHGEDARIVGLQVHHKETDDQATPTILNGQDYDLFDIETLDKDGHILKPKFPATVSLPIDAGKSVAHVVYLPNSNEREVLPFTEIEQDGQRYVVFTANHFSEYGIVYKPVATVPPQQQVTATTLLATHLEPERLVSISGNITNVMRSSASAPLNQVANVAKATAVLPNTGEEDSRLAVAGTISLLAALGLATISLKKSNVSRR
ncbi:alpha-N-acetylglucosaminidase TIM-barrel domain-containing protein [Streptococcus entericus]|uniref:alpha-N-acetylglucosaminidase TIM-barrel domain-containing protein n=1 Tax=Streptococcus entericus TaxID=155680 RepID=UPI00036EB839|nr:alpha-N-acetylglucosaminidase TIM-barrel domain-containing protein [Streptococcus entericus]